VAQQNTWQLAQARQDQGNPPNLPEPEINLMFTVGPGNDSSKGRSANLLAATQSDPSCFQAPARTCRTRRAAKRIACALSPVSDFVRMGGRAGAPR